MKVYSDDSNDGLMGCVINRQIIKLATNYVKVKKAIRHMVLIKIISKHITISNMLVIG